MSSTSAHVQVCQMPRSFCRIAGRVPYKRAFRINNLGNVSAATGHRAALVGAAHAGRRACRGRHRLKNCAALDQEQRSSAVTATAGGAIFPERINQWPCPGDDQIRWQNIASRSFGSNQVLLGGMMPPASAMLIKSSMLVGNMLNAQAYSPLLTSFSSSAVPRMPPTKLIF